MRRYTTVFGDGYFYDEEHPPTPTTIVQARYSGVYEDAPWLAFPCDVEWLTNNEDWNGDDGDAQFFWWQEYANAPIGRGQTPDAALADLTKRINLLPTTVSPRAV